MKKLVILRTDKELVNIIVSLQYWNWIQIQSKKEIEFILCFEW